MAIRDEIISTLVEGLAALQGRLSDVEAIKLTPGAQGERGEAGPPPSDEEIRAAATRWLEANITQPADGKDGADGRDGLDGKDGADGRAPTDEEISLAVETWMEINRASLRGPAGQDGRSGSSGDTGPRGPAGPRGDIGPIGPIGPAGVGIALVEQRSPEAFWVTLTDGQEFEILLPKPKTAMGGGGGGGIRTIGSADGSVTVTGTTDIDLSVPVAGSTSNVVLLVRNNTGATLTKGTAVYINGAIGQNPTVTKALATSDATSAQTLGLMSANLANNSTGYVTLIGSILDLDTAAFTDGAQLYLSPTVPGALTATKPVAPNHMVYVAVVEHAHLTQGKLFVKVQNGYELDELHDVLITSVANGHLLIYDGATSLWKNTGVLDLGSY